MVEKRGERTVYHELCSEQMDNTGHCNNSLSPRHHNRQQFCCDNRQQQQHQQHHIVEETELGELSDVPAVTTLPASVKPASNITCYDGACKPQQQQRRHRQPIHRLESPWHRLKTVFLVSIIISFIVWLIAYVLLSKYGVV